MSAGSEAGVPSDLEAADRAATKRFRRFAVGLTLVTLALMLGVCLWWPCFVHPANGRRRATLVLILKAALPAYWPNGTGRGVFRELKAQGWTLDFEPETYDYDPQKLTFAQICWLPISTRDAGPFEFWPVRPLPAPIPFRGPRRPLSEVAKSTRDEPIVVMRHERSSTVDVITMKGVVTELAPGDPGYKEAMDATTDEDPGAR